MRDPRLLQAITIHRFTPKKLAQQQRSVFILSSGRTGTNFLAQYLNQYPNVYAVHEPKPSWRLRMWSSAYLEGKTDAKTMPQVLYSLRQPKMAQVIEPYYIESNPFLFGFAEFIDQIFENPTIIHVVRDPRTYVPSSINHGTSSGIKGLANKYIPFTYPRVERILDLKQPLDAIQQVAAFWTIINQHLLKASQKIPNYHLIRFEDLFEKSGRGLHDLMKLLGLKDNRLKKSISHSNKTNVAELSVLPPYDQWTKQQQASLLKLCQPLMKEFGYK